MQITYGQVWAVISRNNRLFIPDCIEKAVLNSLTNGLSIIKQAGDVLQETYKPVDRAITLDYDRCDFVDAYSLYYLRRNSLIPRIALRDLALNHGTALLPQTMRVLDLGCGTGAVTLGLLEMFLHPPFDTVQVHVDAVDVSEASLERLKCHLKEAGLSGFSVDTTPLDLNQLAEFDDFLASHGPYDLVFAANIFNELEHTHSCGLLASLSKHLARKAAITIANAQRDFIKELQPLLVTAASQNGLNVYYPCPISDMQRHDCWFWREHEYDCNRLRSKGGQFILSNHREQLVATWLILCNGEYSIFDNFKIAYPDLEWGTFRIRGKDSRLSECEVCTSHGRRVLGTQANSLKRGSIVGLAKDTFEVKQYFEYEENKPINYFGKPEDRYSGIL